MSLESSLPSRLAAALPLGVAVRAYHLSTPPQAASAIFASLPGHDQEPTFCESHFLAVAAPKQDDQEEVLVYAVEILIFTTPTLTTLFVSKADSSGLSARLNVPKGSPSVVAAITATFVEFLLEPRLTTSRVVLSLFARAQNQYLFPGSIENVGKHVLDDRQLIKWWCRVLDRVLRLERPETISSAHLIVPGCDRGETKAFFPPSSRADPVSDPKWINSYPVDLLVVDPSKPPRHLIPRFPDDPKSRFLDDLDGDYIDDQGHWRSVRTLDHFWEMLSYRQECAAGSLVGFLWLVFSGGQETHAALSDLNQDSRNGGSRLPVEANLPTPRNSQLDENGALEPAVASPPPLGIPVDPKSPPSSSPVHHDLAGLSTEDPAGRNVLESADVPTSETKTFEKTQGEILLDAAQYQSLMDFLLQTDFTGDVLASQSTRVWIEKSLELSRTNEFGRPVSGCGAHSLAQSSRSDSVSSAPVNVLTGIRKKRKADMADLSTTQDEARPTATVPAVSTLSPGLIRKKPKN